MPETCYHPSLEGAQHGAKSLTQFLDYARASGTTGAQPSNFMLEKGKRFKSPEEIKGDFAAHGLTLDGISAHCPFWVHTTAWTNSPTVRPFLPPDVGQQSATAIEKWSEDYLMRLLDLAAALGVKIIPMFWGVAFGWELATGYPWGFWKGGDYDLLARGRERFVKKTAALRARARELGIFWRTKFIPARRPCARRFQPAGANLRRRQVPGGQRRPVPLLGGGGSGRRGS